jgi:hypothetical protein
MKTYYGIGVFLLLLWASQMLCMEKAVVEAGGLNAHTQALIDGAELHTIAGAAAHRGGVIDSISAEQKIVSHEVLVPIFDNVVREQILGCVQSIKNGIITQAELQGVVTRLVVVAKIIAYVARIREQELVAIVQRSLSVCCQCVPAELLEPCFCAQSRIQGAIVPIAEVICRSLYEKTFPTHTIHAAIESARSAIKAMILKQQQPFIESREKFLATIRTIKEIIGNKNKKTDQEPMPAKELAAVQQRMANLALQESSSLYMQQLVDAQVEKTLGQFEGEIRSVVEQCVRIIFACCEHD